MPILLNRTRMYLNKPREADIDVPYCTMFSDAELLEIYEEFNYQDASLLGRPSNGFIVTLAYQKAFGLEESNNYWI